MLFAGKLESQKAPLDLLAAFRQAVGQRQELRLLFVGSGVLESVIDTAAAEDDRIGRVPFQNQSLMPQVYRAGDITCLPSHSETWGLCLNESMASGRPILASSKVGAVPDLVNERTGFAFSAGSVPELTELLCRLPTRKKLLEMGRDCQTIINDWSYAKNVASIAEQLRRENVG